MFCKRQFHCLLIEKSAAIHKYTSQAHVLASRGYHVSCRTLQQEQTDAENIAERHPDDINPDFVNRNPRNLEQMGLARKPVGWKLQYPSKTFYHRLLFSKTTVNTEAKVIHNSGLVVVSASTKEQAIANHLYSKVDVSAAENIGRVLAHRCRECGITSMLPQLGHGQESAERIQAFLKALEDGGIELTEVEPYEKPYEPGIDYDDPPVKQSTPNLRSMIKDMVKQENIKLN